MGWFRFNRGWTWELGLGWFLPFEMRVEVLMVLWREWWEWELVWNLEKILSLEMFIKIR